MALGYVVLRGGLETVCYIAMATGWVLLMPLSQVYVRAGALDASILTIVFCLGALIFNYLLYQTRLVPRWLSGWGLIAIVPYPAAGLLAMFGTITALPPTYAIPQLQLALQEMVLALWLIVKGFDPSATVLGTAKTEPSRV